MNQPLALSLTWTVIGFVSGSLMFALWFGRWFSKANIREYGDGNPGAANAWKAGGWKVGFPSGLLDFAKGAVPVGMAVWVFGIQGWYLVPVALAPVLGHAFCPWLGFKGGKGVAVTLGVWTGITLWEGVIILGLGIGLLYLLLNSASWSVILAMLGFLGYLILKGIVTQGIPLPLVAVWAGNMFAALYRHWPDIKEGVSFRPYILRLFRSTS